MNLDTAVNTYSKWLKAHERLLIIGLSAYLLFHFYGQAINAWIEHDKRISTIAAQKVQSDTDTNKALSDQLNLLKSEVNSQSSILQQAINKRDQQQIIQKETDANLSPNDLVKHWAQLLNQNVGLFTLPDSAHVMLTEPIAVQTVQSLDDLTVCKADLNGVETQLSLSQNLTTQTQKNLDQMTVSLTDEKSSHQKDINTLKAENHQSWIHGFKWGFGVGLVIREVIGIAIHHP